MKIKTIRQKKATKPKQLKKIIDATKQMAFLAACTADEKKGEDILLIDVSKLTVIADYFLIVTVKSVAQAEGLAGYIRGKLSDAGFKIYSKEGISGNNWIVLDCGSVVIHIMRDFERTYYKIEQFWSNGKIIDKKEWLKT